MKKFFSILLVFVTILSFIGCSNLPTEEKIATDGKNSMQGFTPEQETIKITHNFTNTEYTISINQTQHTYTILPETDENDFSWTNIQGITSSNILKTISASKELVINYIDESVVLKDKEDLISYINNLPFKSADFPNEGLIAAFDGNYDTVFLNIESKLLDKHTIVHELFHALANKTRSNSTWDKYCTTLFDEAFTELLASSVISANYPTTYDNSIRYVYHFLGCTGIDGISAYFYGLSEVKISTSDFHLYTLALECLDESWKMEDKDTEKLTLHLILSKWWGLEK